MKKTAVITGASRGIGKGIALSLAQNGYNLGLICHNNIDALNKFKNELETNYDIKVYTYQGDVADINFVSAFGNDILQKFNHIDVVINNAGIADIGLLTDLSVEKWHQIIDTNLSALFYTSKIFVPNMVSQKSGNIINISSMWGSVGASCEVAYSASKGGVNSFTKALAKELAPSNIAVNAIACGVIDTDMNSMLNDEEKASLIAAIPCDRMGTPFDVAKTVLSIIAAPSYMTGQIIGLDGGYI